MTQIESVEQRIEELKQAFYDLDYWPRGEGVDELSKALTVIDELHRQVDPDYYVRQEIEEAEWSRRFNAGEDMQQPKVDEG